MGALGAQLKSDLRLCTTRSESHSVTAIPRPCSLANFSSSHTAIASVFATEFQSPSCAAIATPNSSQIAAPIAKNPVPDMADASMFSLRLLGVDSCHYCSSHFPHFHQLLMVRVKNIISNFNKHQIVPPF
ncbi:hypothetical protein Fot_50465 [Forsythia ovata]|uniref:Uncharacterized protein n=1 Tax=Forsythia ovata TaxID=205694 RepID=A0ABD1PY82_9LAMI